jgi:hypothetical protein
MNNEILNKFFTRNVFISCIILVLVAHQYFKEEENQKKMKVNLADLTRAGSPGMKGW